MKVIRLVVFNGQVGTTHFIVCRVLEWAVGTLEAHEDILRVLLLRSTSITILEVATLQLHQTHYSIIRKYGVLRGYTYNMSYVHNCSCNLPPSAVPS